MKRIIAITMFLILLIPQGLIAQDKKVSFLRTGESASFGGYLISPAAYAELKFKGEENKETLRLQIDLELSKATLPLELKLKNEIDANVMYKRMCTDRLASKDKTIIFYENKIEEATTPSFWDEIKFPVGVTIGVVATFATFLIVDTLDDNVFEDQ